MKLITIWFLILNSYLALAQEAAVDEFSEENIPEQKDIFADQTTISKPTKLRDPFKSPVPEKKVESQTAYKKSAFKNGIYTNVPNLDTITLDTVKVRGVLMGVNTRALIADKGNIKAVILAKEGDKINKGKVELKAILPRGVVFVEQITNVYGQFEYLETVVPISD